MRLHQIVVITRAKAGTYKFFVQLRVLKIQLCVLNGTGMVYLCYKEIQLPMCKSSFCKATAPPDVFLPLMMPIYMEEMKHYEQEVGKPGDILVLLLCIESIRPKILPGHKGWIPRAHCVLG